MATWQQSNVLALDKIIRADGAGKVARVGRLIRWRSRRRGPVGGVGLGVFWLLGGCHCFPVGTLTLWRVLGSRVFRVHGHFHITLDDVRFAIVGVAEFHDRNCLQHGPCDPPCSTLPWSPSRIPRSVAFGVSVGADGAGDDDPEEEGGDDACDAVQDDHGCPMLVGPWTRARERTCVWTIRLLPAGRMGCGRGDKRHVSHNSSGDFLTFRTKLILDSMGQMRVH